MKRNLLLILSFVFLSFWSFAQEKKYILVEHFTNTRCPICSSRNPQLFNTIEDYPDDVHHISIHPPYPYSTCVFYQSNTSENRGRAEYYNVQGTPTAVVQGTLINGSQLLPVSEITSRLGDTPDVSIVVTETGNMDREISIDIKNLLDIELSGDYKLFVAVAEKEIMYAAPNGEQVHHNVFRQYLSGLEGTAVTMIPATSTQAFNFDYTIQEEWNPDEIYVLAYLQNTQTNEILNSGSSLDQLLSSDNTVTLDEDWNIYPNPAEGIFTVVLPSDAKRISIHNITGQELYQADVLTQSDRHLIDSNFLRKGSYFVRIEGSSRIYTRKLIKI